MEFSKLTVFMPKRKVVAGAILVALLLLVLGLTPPAFAESTETAVHNITVDTAYDMITDGSFPNLVILDVRYQYEYDLGHLYDAVLIRYDELETRIGELEEHKNHEIIVYCKSGGRSQIACEILVECNFTKVYNVLGGVLAQIDAGYPIRTTSHLVTVNIVDGEILLQIEPLLPLLPGCVSCAENQTCPGDNEPTEIQSTVLEQEENHEVILLTYEVNGTMFEFTIANTLLWSYNELTDEINRTAKFISTEITTEDMFMQFYDLSYQVQHVEYKLTLSTFLVPLNAETYNSSLTIMEYSPAKKFEVASLEVVKFNSTVTFSGQYAILGKVAKELGKLYEKSGDESLALFAQAYYPMEVEAKSLSKLVEKQLEQYDQEILRSSAVLRIPDPTTKTYQVSAVSDDCRKDTYETGGHNFNTIGSYILAGTYRYYTGYQTWYESGMRFTNVDIPQGSTIKSAYLKLRAWSDAPWTTVNTRITGEDTGNSATFTDLANYDARARTSAYSDWDNIPPWTQGTWYTSPDIKGIIQEIVDRGNWESGHALSLFWADHGSTTGVVSCYRTATAYDDSTANAPPRLEITYEAPDPWEYAKCVGACLLAWCITNWWSCYVVCGGLCSCCFGGGWPCCVPCAVCAGGVSAYCLLRCL